MTSSELTSPPGAPRALSLAEAIDLAGGASDALKIARAGIQQASGQQLQARSEYFPQLTGSASYTRTLESEFANTSSSIDLERFGFGAANQYNLTFDLSWTLFDWGNRRGQNALARAARRSAEIELTAQQAQLTLNVAELYYDAVLADILVSIADSSFVQSERALRQTEAARAVGSQSGYQLLSAQVTRNNQVPTVLQRRSTREIAHYRLKQMLNLPVDQPVSLTTPVEDTASGNIWLAALAEGDVTLPDTSPDARAGVRQQMETVRQQEATLRSTRAQRFPAISVTSSYGRVAYPSSGFPKAANDFRTNWTVGVSLSVPLFTGGRLRGEMRSARASVDEARARLDQTRDQAALDTRQTQLDVRQAEVAFEASASTVGQAGRAYRIAEVRFAEGMETQRELTDARLSLAESRSNRAQAARDLQVARVRLALMRHLPLQ